MAPGWPIAPTEVTLTVLAEDDPQLLFAVTLIFPLLAPAVSVILFVVELPDHPAGNVQMYEDDPTTAGTE